MCYFCVVGDQFVGGCGVQVYVLLGGVYCVCDIEFLGVYVVVEGQCGVLVDVGGLFWGVVGVYFWYDVCGCVGDMVVQWFCWMYVGV